MTKSSWAKVAGWGQAVIFYVNSALDGQPIPNTRAGFLKLLSSLVLAVSVHIASNTSAGHPNGAVS